MGSDSRSSGREVTHAVIPAVEWRRRERQNIRTALELANGRIYGPDGAAELLGSADHPSHVSRPWDCETPKSARAAGLIDDRHSHLWRQTTQHRSSTWLRASVASLARRICWMRSKRTPPAVDEFLRYMVIDGKRVTRSRKTEGRDTFTDTPSCRTHG